MFFAPKEIKQETGESLVYNPHRTLVSKEFTFDAAHHLFHLDHRYLNETLPYMNTTAENMVYWIFQTMNQELPDERGLRLEYVRLYETPTAFAEFRREWLDD